MEQHKCRTNVGVMLFSKFEFIPFRGKTIVVVGRYIPECNVMNLPLFEFIYSLRNFYSNSR